MALFLQARDEANATYHKWEWKLRKCLMTSLGLTPLARLVLRMVTLLEPKELIQIILDDNKDEETSKEDRKKVVDDARRVFGLFDDEKKKKKRISAEDEQRAVFLTAVYLKMLRLVLLSFEYLGWSIQTSS